MRRKRTLLKSTGGIMLAVFACAGLALGGCSETGPDSDASATAGSPHPGEEIYNQFCFSCHASGVADAPRVGDVASWAPRAAKGKALLLASTKEGIPPSMPAMGMCFSCSDAELEAVIDFMISPSQD